MVSIIIPVYNDPLRLQTLIESLIDQDYPEKEYEIIIADNGSTDNTLTSARRFETKYPQQVKIVVERDIQSSYAARNKGLHQAKGDIIAFTDSDCIASPDWINEGVKGLKKECNCGLSGGRIELLYKDPNHPNVFELYDGYSSFLQKSYIEKSGFSVTANIFTFRHVFDSVGIFDAELESGGDCEWGNRVASKNYTLAYNESAVIYHPARCNFRQHLKKTKRVAQGQFDLYYSQHCLFKQFKMFIAKDSLPPVQRILSVFSENRIKTVNQKFKVALLILFFKYLNSYLKLKQLALNRN